MSWQREELGQQDRMEEWKQVATLPYRPYKSSWRAIGFQCTPSFPNLSVLVSVLRAGSPSAWFGLATLYAMQLQTTL